MCLLKQIVGIVPKLIDRKHKLAVFVGTSPRLFDFETVEGAGMSRTLANATSGSHFQTSLTPRIPRKVELHPQQLRDLTSACQVAKAETATSLIQKTELREFVYHVGGQLA